MNYKPTHICQELHFSSCHPSHYLLGMKLVQDSEGHLTNLTNDNYRDLFHTCISICKYVNLLYFGLINNMLTRNFPRKRPQLILEYKDAADSVLFPLIFCRQFLKKYYLKKKLIAIQELTRQTNCHNFIKYILICYNAECRIFWKIFLKREILLKNVPP